VNKARAEKRTDTKAKKSNKARTYWIEDARQIEAVAHPARQEIIDRLVAVGPMSVREIADTLGRNVTTLYHHLKVLEELGLIKVSSAAAGDRGRPYVVYRAIAPRVRLLRAAMDPKFRGPISKWARVVGAQAAKEYVAGLSHPSAKHVGAERNEYITRFVMAPSRARLARINELLEEVAELAWTQDPDPGPPLSIGWFISPLDRPNSSRAKRASADKKESGGRPKRGS
jgi:predicted ArsR family transcriptional regulator